MAEQPPTMTLLEAAEILSGGLISPKKIEAMDAVDWYADQFDKLPKDAEGNVLNGVLRIVAERRRQIEEENWTPQHDDRHSRGAIALAAACYAIPPHVRGVRKTLYTPIDTLWPWSTSWWKPTPDNRVRELEKAGALIAAEIDRLERKAAAEAAAKGAK